MVLEDGTIGVASFSLKSATHWRIPCFFFYHGSIVVEMYQSILERKKNMNVEHPDLSDMMLSTLGLNTHRFYFGYILTCTNLQMYLMSFCTHYFYTYRQEDTFTIFDLVFNLLDPTVKKTYDLLQSSLRLCLDNSFLCLFSLNTSDEKKFGIMIATFTI